MIELFEAKEFLKDHDGAMYYVGFLRSEQTWFPLAWVSDPRIKRELDTLLLSRSCVLMHDMVKNYATQVQEVQEVFVQYLMPREIESLMERYGLQQVAFIHGEADSQESCGCGCGCG
jgi:hypothetical protein